MKKRSEEKGGRKSARKAHRLVRSKADTSASVLLSAPGEKIFVHGDLTNSVEEWRLIDEYESALHDLMRFYNRATEPESNEHGCGWSAADIVRLEEIRQLLLPSVRMAI